MLLTTFIRGRGGGAGLSKGVFKEGWRENKELKHGRRAAVMPENKDLISCMRKYNRAARAVSI